MNAHEHHSGHTNHSPRATCDETRATRLHYQLRCLLPPGHDGAHQWTPELLPSTGGGAESATG